MKTKLCPVCSQTKLLSEFGIRHKRGADKPSSYCKSCDNKRVKERQRNLKQQCVDYKGGVCSICGYNKCLGALEFHHLNPEEKDFGIAKLRCKNINDVIKQELDKCILVCANCHRELHETV